jgi:hypothetical protein
MLFPHLKLFCVMFVHFTMGDLDLVPQNMCHSIHTAVIVCLSRLFRSCFTENLLH